MSGDQRSFLINFNLKPLNFHQIKVLKVYKVQNHIIRNFCKKIVCLNSSFVIAVVVSIQNNENQTLKDVSFYQDKSSHLLGSFAQLC